MFDQLELEMEVVERYLDEKKRYLNFSGTRNFRDLGGYQAADGRTTRWKVLYRSDHLHKLNDNDFKYLAALRLDKIIDFRAEHEKEVEPDRIPANMDVRLVDIPILDGSTELWRNSRDKFVNDNMKNIDPAKFMTKTSVELATRFTPKMRRFVQELLSSKGYPVLFHCAAGKDRTGYAAAILLRILDVPMNVIVQDYLISNQYYLSSYEWNLKVLRVIKGAKFAEVVKGFLEVQSVYLATSFETIDHEFGSFDEYVRNGLDLTEKDIEALKRFYLE